MTAPGSPSYQGIILDYWTSGHYGAGDNTEIPAGQEWKRVVGPIFVYFNSLADPKIPPGPNSISSRPPPAVACPPSPQSGTTTALPSGTTRSKSRRPSKQRGHSPGSKALITRTRPSAPPSVGNSFSTILRPHPRLSQSQRRPHPRQLQGLRKRVHPARRNGPIVTWPHDGNYYQFWTEGAADGRFTIPNVRPGTYTLHAFANGVLGEFAKADITVEAGKKIDLGKITWQPVRYGKQIWDIGYPDRTGDKFFKGDADNYWLWGWGLRYSGLFPNDITYTIGKSDYHKDWFFQEVPHSTTAAWLNPPPRIPTTSGSAGLPPHPARPIRGRSGGRAALPLGP